MTSLDLTQMTSFCNAALDGWLAFNASSSSSAVLHCAPSQAEVVKAIRTAGARTAVQRTRARSSTAGDCLAVLGLRINTPDARLHGGPLQRATLLLGLLLC